MLEGKLIEVISPGTSVVIGSEILGSVTGIGIRGKGHVSYEVSWWNGNSHECKWFESFEVEQLTTTKRLTIGFQPNANNETE